MTGETAGDGQQMNRGGGDGPDGGTSNGPISTPSEVVRPTACKSCCSLAQLVRGELREWHGSLETRLSGLSVWEEFGAGLLLPPSRFVNFWRQVSAWDGISRLLHTTLAGRLAGGITLSICTYILPWRQTKLAGSGSFFTLCLVTDIQAMLTLAVTYVPRAPRRGYLFFYPSSLIHCQLLQADNRPGQRRGVYHE